jgi:hypothetical protein
MMNRKIKDIYVTFVSSKDQFPLVFSVRLPDNYEKIYKIEEYEFRSARCSVRDYVENSILDYYESLGEHPPTFRLLFD